MYFLIERFFLLAYSTYFSLPLLLVYPLTIVDGEFCRDFNVTPPTAMPPVFNLRLTSIPSWRASWRTFCGFANCPCPEKAEYAEEPKRVLMEYWSMSNYTI